MARSPYLDENRSVTERVEAILALMSEDQKLSCFRGVPEMTLADGYALPGIDNRFEETLHGSGHHAEATMFPQAIGLGATWHPELVERIGAVVGIEMRARTPQHLVSFGPVADIRCNPLAGRFEEGYGEDPFHVGTFVTAYGFGLRGRHPVYVQTITEMKHFLGYNHEWHRHRGSSSMGVRALREYHVPPHRMPLRAGAILGAMTSYNLVNGVPSVISPIMDEVRHEWVPHPGFIFLPDGGDAVNLFTTKGAPFDTWEVPRGGDVSYVRSLAAELGHATDDRETLVLAAALMLKAGQSYFADGSDVRFDEAAITAVRENVLGLTMADAERVVRDWLTVLVRSGRLDGDACPYNRLELDPRPHLRPESQALALQAAREQMVLLKNDGLLPLQGTPRTAVVGPLSDVNLRDYYSPTVDEGGRVTPLQALIDRLGAGRVAHHRGNDTVAWRANDRYVSVGPDGILTAGAEAIGDTESFEVYDWGHDQYFFRQVASDRFVEANYLDDGPVLRVGSGGMVDANSWYTYQNFHYRHHGDQVTIFGLNHVAGELSAADAHYVRVDEEGNLPLSRGTAEAAFAETLVANGPAAAAAMAAESDYAIVVIGNHPLVNARETHDRPGLDLAPRQADLVREVAASKPGRTVVVIVSSYPFAVGEIEANPNVGAILYTSHAGQGAGTALAEALFGEYSPAGRLTSTWLADITSLPPAGPYREEFRVSEVDMLEYDVISARLTYRFTDAVPVYAFGHGLTYTQFDYNALEVPTSVPFDRTFTATLEITNTGTRTSDEVVQVYATSLDSAYGDGAPKRQLAGFKRVQRIEPGQVRRVEIEIDPRTLFVWDVVRHREVVECGRYELHAGASSADLRLSRLVHIDGEVIAPLDMSAIRNSWEYATTSRGVSYWEISKRRTLAREGGYHSVVSRRPGDYIGFTKVILDGVTGIELRTATTPADWASLSDPVIEIHTGTPDGPLLGVVTVPVTGDIQSFVDTEAPLTGATGIENLYLRFRVGGIYLESIRLRNRDRDRVRMRRPRIQS